LGLSNDFGGHGTSKLRVIASKHYCRSDVSDRDVLGMSPNARITWGITLGAFSRCSSRLLKKALAATV
jgi:hypothetical protein